MAFLKLSLYQHPSGATLAPNRVIEKLQASLPQARRLPGDQLTLRAERAEARFADELQKSPDSPARVIVETLRRNAQLYGPAYAFEIPVDGDQMIQGTARKYDLIFLFDEPLPEGMRQRLIDFLKSFGVGKVEASTNDKRQSEVLCDIPGDGRSANGLPLSAAVVRPDSQPSESA